MKRGAIYYTQPAAAVDAMQKLKFQFDPQVRAGRAARPWGGGRGWRSEAAAAALCAVGRAVGQQIRVALVDRGRGAPLLSCSGRGGVGVSGLGLRGLFSSSFERAFAPGGQRIASALPPGPFPSPAGHFEPIQGTAAACRLCLL